ncbi:MAG: YraN family protein [Gammaproteobacteria bacterium]
MALIGANRRATGQAAEKTAERYLTRQGLSLVTRNFAGQRGEIDLIMSDGATLVFVEVRSRRSGRFGTASETIDARKQAKLIQTAQLFLATGGDRGGHNSDRPCRFDTIAFDGEVNEKNLRWIRNAFSA